MARRVLLVSVMRSTTDGFVYEAVTHDCTYRFDLNWICVEVIPSTSDRSLLRRLYACEGAQLTSALDPTVPGCLVPKPYRGDFMPPRGTYLLMVKRENGVFVVLRSARVICFERTGDTPTAEVMCIPMRRQISTLADGERAQAMRMASPPSPR